MKRRYLIGPVLAALVYLGLYAMTGYAMDTPRAMAIVVIFFGGVFAVSTGAGWGLAQALTQVFRSSVSRLV